MTSKYICLGEGVPPKDSSIQGISFSLACNSFNVTITGVNCTSRMRLGLMDNA